MFLFEVGSVPQAAPHIRIFLRDHKMNKKVAHLKIQYEKKQSLQKHMRYLGVSLPVLRGGAWPPGGVA